MKIITLVFVSLFYFTSTAQYYENFDTISSDQIYYDTLNPDNHIWQIGQTNKPFFDNEWAIVTDTTNMYDSLTDATLNLTLTRSGGSGFAVEFDHKLDTDLNHAGGFIEFNIDNDSVQYQVFENGANHTYSTWNFIVDFNSDGMFYTDLGHKIYPYNLVDYYGDENMYNIANSSIDTITFTDTLRQHINTFTGTYDNWEHIKLHLFYQWSLKAEDEPDTLNLKFHFISDSLSNNKNGWAIKNVFSGGVYYGSLNENEIISELMGYPTPTGSNYTVHIENNKNEIITVDILNLNGQLVQKLTKSGEQIELDLSDLQRGNYIIKYYIDNTYRGFSKVIKQ